MFIARQVTDKSWERWASTFGGRDHTTVLHGCRKTEELIARDAELRQTAMHGIAHVHAVRTEPRCAAIS